MVNEFRTVSPLPKRARSSHDAPDAQTEPRAANLKKLEGKLAEYTRRFKEAEERLADTAPEVKAQDRAYLSAAYKMLTAEHYLQNPNTPDIDEFAIVAEIRQRGLPLNKEILFNALGVVENYVTTSGADVRGGTGFGEREPQKTETEQGERVELWEARNRDAVGEVVKEVTDAAQAAEAKESKKVAKHANAVADTFDDLAESFAASAPLVDDAKDFAQDFSDAVVGTSLTDKMKGWIFGKENVQARTPAEQRRGIREVPAALARAAREYPAPFLRQVVDIPRDLARNLEAWSPNALHEREQLAREMEARARETRDRILSGMPKEADAIYRQGLSPENQAKLEEMRDRAENVQADYNDELARSKEVRGGTIENAAKLFAWTGVTLSLDTLSYVGGMGDLLKEMGQSLASGIRGERRNLWAEHTGNAPYSREATSLNAPQEKAMSVMERLGDWIMTKAVVLEGERGDFSETVREEVTTARQKEASIFQEALSQRIETLTKKAKLTKEDQVEIGKLVTKLNLAQKGLVGARELGDLIERASALGKKNESQKDAEHLLMGYLSGRAINTVKNLEVLPLEARNALVKELQEHPSREALQAAETLLYASLDENVHVAGMAEISAEQRKQLEEAHAVLKESLTKATDVYKESLATVSADIVKGLQAANRELKKTASQYV